MQFPAPSTPPMDTETLARRAKLYSKINALQVAMKRVPKNGWNEFHKYAYALESDIMDAVRVELETIKLAFLPPRVLDFEIIERPKKSGASDFMARVMIEYGIGDCETGETITTVIIGEGADSLDKAFYKAYSGGAKYNTLKALLIATGDDPEQTAKTADQGATYTAPSADRPALLTMLKAALDATPEARRPVLTQKQVGEMTDNDIVLLVSSLLTVSVPVEG